MFQLARPLGLLPVLFVLYACETPNAEPGPDATQMEGDYPVTGGFERLHPDFDRLVPEDARLEVIATDLVWSEGPAWRRSGNYLVFSDVINNTIHSWSEAEGLGIFLRPSGYMWPDPAGHELGSNGLAFDAEDRLIIADHGNRQLVRLDESNYTKVTLADNYGGSRLNSPNDIAIHSSGDIYFTDPPYGLDGLYDSPDKELDFSGVYRLSVDTGELTLLTDELRFPNGIAFSPDEQILYVANTSSDPLIMSYDVQDDGTIANGRVFFDVRPLVGPERRGNPDGMCVDVEGNLFATGPGGVLVFSPEGEHLGTILTGQPTGNCTFGDGGSTMYIPSNMNLLRVRLNTVGLGFD